MSKSSIRTILAANKGFIFWLADQTGYKSRIRHSDADYFNMDAKGARVASAVCETPYPFMQMARHAFSYMPEVTEIDRRNKALFAFLMLTVGRDGAIASLRIKHINLIDGYVYQDARDVWTKNSKTITTYFLPVDAEYLAFFKEWMRHLNEVAQFGPDDPLFPPAKIKPVYGAFKVVGVKREVYKNANAICAVIKEAFTRADLPSYTPHAFRKTLVKWADRTYPIREAFKAFSQNIGHTSVVTTISAYCPVSVERKGELIKGRVGQKRSANDLSPLITTFTKSKYQKTKVPACLNRPLRPSMTSCSKNLAATQSWIMPNNRLGCSSSNISTILRKSGKPRRKLRASCSTLCLSSNCRIAPVRSLWRLDLRG